MCHLIFKINIINLIVYLKAAELHSVTISSQFEDSTNNNHKNINHLYDNLLNVIVNTSNHNTTSYNANDQFNNKLSTESHLQKSVVTRIEIKNITLDAVPSITWETEKKLLQNTLFKLKRENERNSCLLDSLKTNLKWWTYSNGTLKKTNLNVLNLRQQLDLSHQNISNDEELLKLISPNTATVAFSLAYNKLRAAPFQTLQMMTKSLKYLSLMGNPFIECISPNCILNDEDSKDQDAKKPFKNNRASLAWATFPYMPSLLELDISDCNIEIIGKKAFKNLTNLRNLYMSYNKMLTIKSNTFQYLPSLQVLDLSFTSVYDSLMKYVKASPNLESVMPIVYGLNIEKYVFWFLPNLRYLDLSHSSLSRSSAVAFTHIGPNLNYLSLCYTSFPVFGNGILRKTSLIGLDLSGNSNAVFSITEDVFEGLSESLTYLFFEKANLRDLSWLKPLHNLRYLGLAGNNINTLSAADFSRLNQLQILDLTSNQVGNWYSQVFMQNKNLRVLSLKDNNINMITSEMLKDFSMLVYLSLGNNNFICDCLLRNLVDIAALNNKRAKCRENFWQDLRDSNHLKQILQFSKLFFNTSIISLDIPSLIVSQNLQKIIKYGKTLKRTSQFENKPKTRFVLNFLKSYNTSKACLNQYNTSNLNNLKINSTLFKLQLLDYDEDQYWCYNETKRQNVMGLNCQRSMTFVEDIEEELNTLSNYVMASLGSIILLATLGTLIYCKRWHIYYYYSSLKSAALLSVVSKDNLKKFNSLSDQNPNMIYDIFISYCESDRDWIVDEFIPNVEDNGDISICLHERDFQVGVTILDNIVSCMERSKALMFILSSNFLLSHWCQFEMQLAQHHIFDFKKDHLILVLLEDIPRNKRPKNLQFLMSIKTYIKWPGGKCRDANTEERKLFWKRLKHTLKNLGLISTESKA